jgi:hypothetical protein
MLAYILFMDGASRNAWVLIFAMYGLVLWGAVAE